MLAFLLAAAHAAPDVTRDPVLPTASPNPFVNPAADAPAEPADAPELAFLRLDCKVPAEVVVDAQKVAQLWYPGEAEFRLVPGKHVLRVFVAGTPTEHELLASPGGHYTVLVGKTGTSVAADAGTAPVAVGPATLGVRLVGVGAAQVRIDDRREVVRSGTDLRLELAPGLHPISVRSADGTAIWSNGVLEVAPGSAVLQVSEGRVPEVSGNATFRAGG